MLGRPHTHEVLWEQQTLGAIVSFYVNPKNRSIHLEFFAKVGKMHFSLNEGQAWDLDDQNRARLLALVVGSR